MRKNKILVKINMDGIFVKDISKREKHCFSYLKDEKIKNKPYLSSSDFVKSNDNITDVYNKIISVYPGCDEIIFDSLRWAIHK